MAAACISALKLVYLCHKYMLYVFVTYTDVRSYQAAAGIKALNLSLKENEVKSWVVTLIAVTAQLSQMGLAPQTGGYNGSNEGCVENICS